MDFWGEFVLDVLERWACLQIPRLVDVINITYINRDVLYRHISALLILIILTILMTFPPMTTPRREIVILRVIFNLSSISIWCVVTVVVVG